MTQNELNALKSLADRGDATSQCKIGAYYEHQKDYATAIYWYKMAALQNKGDAQFRIGYLMLVEDAGSFDEGMHWMCCSHWTGLAKATNFLNLMIENAANEDAMYSLVHSSLEQVKRDTEINGLEYVPHKTKSSGGCYIATAVYGSYDATEVLVLRRFRDEILEKYALGRAFIRFYYAVSPPLAEKLKSTKHINRFVRNRLDSFVSWLRCHAFNDNKFTGGDLDESAD